MKKLIVALVLTLSAIASAQPSRSTPSKRAPTPQPRSTASGVLTPPGGTVTSVLPATGGGLTGGGTHGSLSLSLLTSCNPTTGLAWSGTAWGCTTGDGSVKAYGAKGDGTTDDTAAIQNAITAAADSANGRVFFPPGTYKTTLTLNVTSSNITIEGQDAEILFLPSPPIVGGVNDRALYIYGGNSTGYNITGSLAVGATSFTAANAGDAAGMVFGDWLTLQEYDPGSTPDGEIVTFDWVQVYSVSGATVNLMTPIRTPFSGTHSTIQFKKMQTGLVKNVTVRDMRFRSTDAGHSLVAVAITAIRESTFDHITTAMANGDGIFTYRAAELSFTHINQRSGFVESSEFAATVGLTVTDSVFANYDVQPTRGVELDFGTAFFTFSHNRVGPAGDIAVEVIYGVHDGVISDNIVEYVRDAGITNTLGILIDGCQRLSVTGNKLSGGAGGSAEGIAAVSALVANGFHADLVSAGNIVADNTVEHFAVPYQVPNSADHLRFQSANIEILSGNMIAHGQLGGRDLIEVEASPYDGTKYIQFQPKTTGDGFISVPANLYFQQYAGSNYTEIGTSGNLIVTSSANSSIATTGAGIALTVTGGTAAFATTGGGTVGLGGPTTISSTLHLTGAATFDSTLAMGANKITGLADGTNPNDAVAFEQIASAINTALSGTTGDLLVFTGAHTAGNYGSSTSTLCTGQAVTQASLSPAGALTSTCATFFDTLSTGLTTGGNAHTAKLADTAVTPGSYTLSSVTFDQQGRATSASSYGGSGSVSDKAITALSASGAATFQFFYDSPGTGLANGATANIIKLADTTITPGSYTYASVTFDQQGRATSASNGTTPLTASNLAGTTNHLLKITGTNTAGDSVMTDDATTFGLASKFTVTESNGNTHVFGTSTLDGTVTAGGNVAVQSAVNRIEIGNTAGSFANSTYFTDMSGAIGGDINIARTSDNLHTNSFFAYSTGVLDNLGIAARDNMKFVVGAVADRGMTLYGATGNLTLTGSMGIGNVTSPLALLDVRGATNGQSDGAMHIVSNKTGWGNITTSIRTQSTGSTSTDIVDFTIDSGGIEFSTGGLSNALKLTHAGAATFGASAEVTTNAKIDQHLWDNGTAPSLTCGTSPTIKGGDAAGVVTVGTATTSCVVTYAHAMNATVPACLVREIDASAVALIVTALSGSAFTVSKNDGGAGGSIAGVRFVYTCTDHNN